MPGLALCFQPSVAWRCCCLETRTLWRLQCIQLLADACICMQTHIPPCNLHGFYRSPLQIESILDECTAECAKFNHAPMIGTVGEPALVCLNIQKEYAVCRIC